MTLFRSQPQLAILETAFFGSLLLASSITTGVIASQSLIFHPVHTSTCQQPVFYQDYQMGANLNQRIES